jgi:hypothetical protein
MTEFSREFPIKCLTPAVLKENGWFTDLLLRWRPAGDAVNSRLDDGKALLVRDYVSRKGEFQHLRVAFRENYMNFYCGGQSIAMVKFGRNGLQAEIHEKYVYGAKGRDKRYVTLTSKGFPELRKGQLVSCNSMQEWKSYLDQWISNANGKIEHEKRFVDLVVAHNTNVIDLEMGLPAISEIPGKKRAPRMDLVALEPHEGWWQVVLWEVKRVGDGCASSPVSTFRSGTWAFTISSMNGRASRTDPNASKSLNSVVASSRKNDISSMIASLGSMCRSP